MSDFQPLASEGTHKLVGEILRHTKNMSFADLRKNAGIILILSQQTAIVALAAVIYYFIF